MVFKMKPKRRVRKFHLVTWKFENDTTVCEVQVPTRENKGSQRETPSVALGIKLFLDVVKAEVCFLRRLQTYLDACKCHLGKPY